MKKSIADHLVTVLSNDLNGSTTFHLSEKIQSFPLHEFHSFADGKICIGAFKINKASGKTLWLLVIDWRNDGNYYVVIYPENNNQAPIAELHDQRVGKDSVDLVWKYSPRKRDGRNKERKEAFVSAVGREDYVVSLPSAIVTLEDFLEDVFSLVSYRVTADGLVDFSNKPARTSFPEGRRIERLHKSRERDSQAVRQAKARHAQLNDGALPCEVCEFDFVERYGKLGASYIEAHHTRPLSDLEEGELRNTKIEDFALVCANCHRMLHRKRPWATIEQLKKLVRRQT
ncbi:HNH endonuclease [Desulfocicer vacuolatum DSM 3385]|uniref:HNH endonuclease n=1 Tax=Desulfocicer vacuolatum DSM 3385 TaxID=1121400 RepID=A0A1W2DDU8_9BACT|nr:HNH endonuclease [Desulfocicer vacuolatum]SMC95414.1 HNH endonuclease [Desulfocicer vacuolatum DSM 3385]